MNDFVRNILQIKFYACCYILLSGTRPKRRCTPICGAVMLLRCNWCRNLVAVNCILHWIVLTLSMLHTRSSSCITSLWLSCVFLQSLGAILCVDAITHVYCYVENSVLTSSVGGEVQPHPPKSFHLLKIRAKSLKIWAKSLHVFFCKVWALFYESKQDWAPFCPDFQILPRFLRILTWFSVSENF